MTRLLTVAIALLLAVQVTAGSNDVSSAYFAPANRLVFKVVWPGGDVREFEHDLSRPGHLRSVDGWSAQMSGEGTVDVSSPDGVSPRTYFRFDRGRLVRFVRDGETMRYAYETPRSAPDGTFPPLLISQESIREAAKEYSYNELLHKWEGSGRLAFPFVNPNQNGVVYAELSMLFLAAALWMRRKVLKGAFASLALASAVCLVLTMSRGAWIGAAAGVASFVAFGRRDIWRNRLFLYSVASAAVAAAIFIVCFGWAHITRGFDGTQMNWSNAIRVEIWRLAPRMMVDAPYGWTGGYAPGPAYVDWYQPINAFALTPTLINDHLTRLVSLSWVGRFAYLFLLFAVFALSVATAVFKRNPLPLAAWLALAIPAWFNPVSHRWVMWIIPVATSVAFVGGPLWRRRDLLVKGAAAGAAFAALVTGLLYALGRSTPEGYVPVGYDGRRVEINGTGACTWVVNDGTLGGGLLGKDVREFYTYRRDAQPVGFVRSIDDLPKSVERLVLAGQAGVDWLTKLSENESYRSNLPRSVIFVSPPFSPSQVPEGVRALCSPRIVVGEFAALFDEEYANPPVWVTVVPGMERYIMRWMEYVTGP